MAEAHGRDHALARPEPHVRGEGVGEAFHEESRRDEQHDGRRHLCADQQTTQPRTSASVGSSSGAGPKRQRSAIRSLQRGCEPEQQAAAIDTIAMKATVPVSTDVSSRLACSAGKNDGSTSDVQSASRRPQAPPPMPRSGLSVSSWRTRRDRPAPSASRTAISRSRAIARETRRPATFAQAMTRTSPTAPSESRQGCNHRLEIWRQSGMAQRDHRPRLGRRGQRAAVRLRIGLRESCGEPRHLRLCVDERARRSEAGNK